MSKNFLAFLLTITTAALIGFLTSGIVHTPQNAEASIFGSFLNQLFHPSAGNSASTKNRTPAAPLYRPALEYEQAVVGSVENAAPAVISIVISKDVPIIENCASDPFGNLPPEFRDFFGPLQFNQPCQKGTRKEEVGGGSGFIVSAEGLVLTNKHVVQDEKAEYTVFTNDGKKYKAEVLARDPVQDLAVVKIINPEGLFKPVTLGDSDSIKLGQTAIAIGNALGEFRNTVSVGVISGLSRSIDAGNGGSTEHLDGLLQTDAAINPGNSGGPLLNLRGEVIGINTAVAAGAQNIGFTIPINSAKRDIESVQRTGTITTPYLGVRYLPITADLMKKEKLPVAYGAVVRGNQQGPAVVPGGPAAKAGIQAEDVIIEVDGQKIDQVHSLFSFIQKHSVGDILRLKILRNGQEKSINVTLEKRLFD